jgi:hypothetical protein
MNEECRGYCDAEWLVHDDPFCPLYEGTIVESAWDPYSDNYEVEPFDTIGYVTMGADI